LKKIFTKKIVPVVKIRKLKHFLVITGTELYKNMVSFLLLLSDLGYVANTGYLDSSVPIREIRLGRNQA
jgi:hypothetical protein